jgi:hypothetical protein
MTTKKNPKEDDIMANGEIETKIKDGKKEIKDGKKKV